MLRKNVGTVNSKGEGEEYTLLEGKPGPEGNQTTMNVGDDVDITLSNVFNRKTTHATNTPKSEREFDPDPSCADRKVIFSLLLATATFLIIFLGNFFHEDDRPAQKALALLVFVAILWASEALPLFVTAMSIPLLTVCLDLQIYDMSIKGDRPQDPLKDKYLAQSVLMSMFSSNVVLIFGGFTLARALQKYRLDRKLALAVLSRITNFKLFLYILMMLGAFLSMWMSNVVAPALIALLVEPALKNADQNTGKCLALAIAFSNNVGGMLTPIASPQNDVAVERLLDQNSIDVGFGKWMGVGCPLGFLHITFVWALLLWYYKPDGSALPQLSVENTPLDRRHWFVIAVLVVTVLFWCFFKPLENFWGVLGTIGLFPVMLLYGTGLMEKSDLAKVNWDILLLLGGGEVLGRVIQDSNLLNILANQIVEAMEGQTPWAYAAVFNVVIMIPTNFISHTVGAITMLPVVADVATKIGQAAPLVIGGVLCCSASCALPVSSFPNVIAYSLTDGDGKKFLTTKDYLIMGIPTQLMIYAITTTLGWGLLQAPHFPE